MTPEQRSRQQELTRVVALAKMRPEDVTAVMAQQIMKLLEHYTPEAAAFHVRSLLLGVGHA